MLGLPHLIADLRAKANTSKAAFFPRFFKTGKGQYGEGDVFIGVTVPAIRAAIRQYHQLSLPDISRLLKNPIHEFRLAGLLILTEQSKKADAKTKKNLADFYLKHAKYVNNWDLVDSSAPMVLGSSLTQKNTKVLDVLAASDNLWKQRIAIVATYHFIRRNEFDATLRIAETLVHHPHDLIHKAVGWMLREVGKRDETTEKKFLQKHYQIMPRTMLRYAIERFPEPERKKYLIGKA